MKILIINLYFILIYQLFPQVNVAPIVENVSFQQRDDGSFMVDISYDLIDPDNNSINIKMLVSENSGLSWDLSCNLISGDIGESVNPGNQKHIIWDFGNEHKEYYSEEIQVKIIADDGSDYTNTTPNALFSISQTTGNTLTSFVFDASASYDTETTIDNLLYRWDFNNDGNFDTDFSSNKVQSKVFSTTGTHTITLEVKDEGELTDKYSKSINVTGPQWYTFDDGTFESSVKPEGYLFVRFNMPDGWNTLKVTKVRIGVNDYWTTQQYNIVGYDDYQIENNKFYPDGTRIDIAVGVSHTTYGWKTYSTNTKFSSSKFFVGIIGTSVNGAVYGPYLAYDKDSNNGRSGAITFAGQAGYIEGNWAIQIYVEPESSNLPKILSSHGFWIAPDAGILEIIDIENIQTELNEMEN